MSPLLILPFLAAIASAQYTCECGIFVVYQFDQGGGQSRPLPLEYIGVEDINNIIDPSECNLDLGTEGACQQFCAYVGSVWAGNNSVCTERPNNALRCFGSVWCEDLFFQERVPDVFNCEPLQVYSRIAQCTVDDLRYEWVYANYNLQDDYLGCNGVDFVACPTFPCTCNDDLTVCSPTGCNAL